jgi:hypothetical protein
MDEALLQTMMNQLAAPSGEAANGAGGDPLLGAVLASLQQRHDEDDEDDTKRLRAELARSRRAVDRLQQSVRAADTMALYISDVFGCCATCWGLNRLCPTCGGGGGPGYREADVERLVEWVAPALARHGLTVADARSSESNGNGTERSEA